jgi:hypothetical protein
MSDTSGPLQRLSAGVALLCGVNLVKDVHSGASSSSPEEILPDAKAPVRQKVQGADRAPAMTDFAPQGVQPRAVTDPPAIVARRGFAIAPLPKRLR